MSQFILTKQLHVLEPGSGTERETVAVVRLPYAFSVIILRLRSPTSSSVVVFGNFLRLVIGEKMLSGLKFIPRDQIDTAQDEKSNASRRERKKSSGRKEKKRRKKKSSHCSSSDDDLERIKKGSKMKKKWYSSDEDFSSYSDKSESESASD
ncbi:hypothetical protein F0562_035415 [Nyssa sinensis]|uniref:Uncharacterized protein n=1 Tax=Nyssa sinensis TaxID=561372 RepID=A0A5J5AD76_9ASTE|nr:hypothetical protein F0562_035415 [Nyssa sinensis]